MTTKIKDGLFISDCDYPQDMEFLSSNKISYIINCCGNELSNRWERLGIRYLTLHWSKTSSELFDPKDNIVFNYNNYRQKEYIYILKKHYVLHSVV